MFNGSLYDSSTGLENQNVPLMTAKPILHKQTMNYDIFAVWKHITSNNTTVYRDTKDNTV